MLTRKEKSETKKIAGRTMSEQPSRTHKQLQQMADLKGFAHDADVSDAVSVDSKRALRRAHKARMKKRARFVASCGWGWSYFNSDRLHLAEKRADYLKECSCWMCGNQRKWHGLTIQEKRHSQGHKGRQDVSGDKEDLDGIWDV